MLFARAKKKDGQSVLEFLIENKAFAKGYSVTNKAGFVYFPISRRIDALS